MASKLVLGILALVVINAAAVGLLIYEYDFFDEPDKPDTNTEVDVTIQLNFNVTEGVSLETDEFQQTFTTNASTVLGVLMSAADRYGFEVETSSHSAYGTFIESIDGIAGNDTYAWVYYVDFEYGDVGASSKTVEDDQIVTWAYEEY